MNEQVQTAQEAQIEGTPVSAYFNKFPEFKALWEQYVKIRTEEVELANKANAKSSARLEFETILKEYVDKFNADKTNPQ